MDAQHDKVSNSKLQHMQECSNSLFEETRPVALADSRGAVASRTALLRENLGRRRGDEERCGMLLDQKAVVFLDATTQHFEDDDEEDDTDAGAGKDGIGRDLP